jgi:predicted aldo/keto reductase-like oxidoreductase
MTFGQGEFRGFRFNVDQKAADGVVAGALEAGINFFDTAIDLDKGYKVVDPLLRHPAAQAPGGV